MIRSNLTRPKARNTQRGFSMIEVLVTILIISLALLGTAGLQAYSMRLNQGGQFRSLAVFLAADLAERIEANKSSAGAGDYVVPSTSGADFLAGNGEDRGRDMNIGRHGAAQFGKIVLPTGAGSCISQVSHHRHTVQNVSWGHHGPDIQPGDLAEQRKQIHGVDHVGDGAAWLDNPGAGHDQRRRDTGLIR